MYTQDITKGSSLLKDYLVSIENTMVSKNT